MAANEELEEARDPSWGGGHQDHLVTGYLRILEGYALKYRAEHFGTDEAISEFCQWLSRRAVWPE